MIDCGIRTVQAQGFIGVYRGMSMTLLRDVPGYFAYFGTPLNEKLSISLVTKLIVG